MRKFYYQGNIFWVSVHFLKALGYYLQCTSIENWTHESHANWPLPIKKTTRRRTTRRNDWFPNARREIWMKMTFDLTSHVRNTVRKEIITYSTNTQGNRAPSTDLIKHSVSWRHRKGVTILHACMAWILNGRMAFKFCSISSEPPLQENHLLSLRLRLLIERTEITHREIGVSGDFSFPRRTWWSSSFTIASLAKTCVTTSYFAFKSSIKPSRPWL